MHRPNIKYCGTNLNRSRILKQLNIPSCLSSVLQMIVRRQFCLKGGKTVFGHSFKVLE